MSNLQNQNLTHAAQVALSAFNTLEEREKLSLIEYIEDQIENNALVKMALEAKKDENLSEEETYEFRQWLKN